MKRVITITVIIFITIISFITPPALAADSTPSAEVKTKLSALQAEIASRAAKLKQEIGRKLQNKAYTGFIKLKSANSLTLATSQGSKIINLNEYTVYQTQLPQAGKAGKQTKNLAVDDYVLALGDIDDTLVLTAKKIIKTASPSAARQAIFGMVTSIEESSILVKNKQGQNITLLTDDGTVFKMGKSEGGLDDIKANKPLIAVGENSRDKILKARFVYILPYSSPIKIKTATPSATPKPAKAATPSGRKKL